MRVVVDLYGGGLERIVAIVGEDTGEDGSTAEPLLRRLADDQLVASLLVLHGLHPDDLATRVQKALVRVRPYLGSHGGDVEVVDADDAQRRRAPADERELRRMSVVRHHREARGRGRDPGAGARGHRASRSKESPTPTVKRTPSTGTGGPIPAG